MDPHTPTSPTQNVKRNPSVEAFPTPSRDHQRELSIRVQGRDCPAPRRLAPMRRAASTPPETTRERATSTLHRATEDGLSSGTNLEKSLERQQLSKKKSQYYSDAFAYREPNNTTRNRVHRDSMVVVDVRLNRMLESEHAFLLDLSFQLSEIYQRPESSIMVMVTPETQIILGGTSEPAYLVTISALQSEIAPTKNKRTTHLLQEFMLDTLKISPKRGIIRFEGLSEGNLATNGMTLLQEVEVTEQLQSSEEGGILRTISRQRSRKGKKTTVPIFTERGKTTTPSSRAATPSYAKWSSRDTAESRSTEVSGPERKRVKHRKSLFTFFKKRDMP